MPVTCKLVNGKHRVVEARTGRIATNASGTPLDGGGHGSQELCQRQARAVNAHLKEKQR